MSNDPRMLAASPEDPLTVGQWITNSARRDPDKAAVVHCDRRLSYRELDEMSTALAQSLIARGLTRGDRVAVLSENRPEQVIALFACAKAGLVYFPMNWRLASRELADQLELVEPSVWFVSALQRHRLADSLSDDARAEDLESVNDCFSDSTSVDLPLVSGSDPLAIIATSGSTGRAKGAVLTHANFFWTNLGLDLAAPITASDTVLQVLPQFHIGGWNVQPMLAWWKGATVILESAFEPGRVLEVIERERVTTMAGVPTTFLLIGQHENFAKADLSTLRYAVVGGAAMPYSLVVQWHTRGVAIIQGYGLTESAPNVFCLNDVDAETHPHSVGRPYAYVEAALFDEAHGGFVDGEGQGELWLRGPSVFAGYWRDAPATQAVMAGDWLRTGDVAARDADGRYRIVGRLKEMFVSGGENVYPVEVENTITSFAGVASAAVVSVDHSVWGEVGVAFVEVSSGTSIDVAALTAHCRAHLASYKVPSHFIVVDELPHNTVGKIDKASLRAAAYAARER